MALVPIRMPVSATTMGRLMATSDPNATSSTTTAAAMLMISLLGSASLHSISRPRASAQVGYWTVAAARGRAVAARAVDAACRWAFTAIPLDRVELCHAVENAASGRVAEKAGFRLEGRLRRSFRYGDGVRHDEFVWGRLAEDPPPAWT